MKVARWGNSLAIRLPQAVAEALDLREGDEVEVRRGAGNALEVTREARREEALRRIDELSRPAPADFRFDRGELYDTARRGFRPDDDGA